MNQNTGPKEALELDVSMDGDEHRVFLETTQSAYNSVLLTQFRWEDQLIASVIDKLKFGYGGYNGWLQKPDELREEIQQIVAHAKAMGRLD